MNGIPILKLTKSYNADKYNVSLLLFLQNFCHSIALARGIKLFIHYRSDTLSGILIFIIQPCLPNKFPALLATRCFISYLILINLSVCVTILLRNHASALFPCLHLCYCSILLIIHQFYPWFLFISGPLLSMLRKSWMSNKLIPKELH